MDANIKVVRAIPENVKKALDVITGQIDSFGHKNALEREIEAVDKKIEEVEAEQKAVNEKFEAEVERLKDIKTSIESTINKIDLSVKYVRNLMSIMEGE